MSDSLSFEGEIGAERASDEPALVVDVEGFEGPLDLLLSLARNQKVDLAKISILALADQYLAFIEAARKLRLELAADYLVMAAWLAYLKSRLLLPEVADPNSPSAEEMANALAWRLKRLEAFREVSAKLMDRPQLQRDVFRRGDPEPITDIKTPEWTATLYDLLSAYAAQRQQSALGHVSFKQRNVWSLQEAREALERLIGAGRRLEPARRVFDFIHGRTGDARDGVRIEPGFDAGTGARRRDRSAPAERVCADLSAQARSHRTCGGADERYRAAHD